MSLSANNNAAALQQAFLLSTGAEGGLRGTAAIGVGDAELRGVPLVRPAADPPRLPRGSRPAGLRPSGRTDGARLERMRGLSESRP